MRILLILGLIFFMGCDNCREMAKPFKARKYFFVVAKKEKINLKVVVIDGVNPITGKAERFREISLTANNVFDEVNIGDTIIKPKGSATVVLGKPSGRVEIPFICYGYPIEPDSVLTY